MAEHPDTQQRVLEAACREFAEKGYRDATVQDICAAAEANVAAVNYYYRSKRQLYLAVWEQMFGGAQELLDGSPSREVPSRERLEALIRFRVGQVYSSGAAAQYRMMIHREMSNHSEVHGEIVDRFIRPGIARLIKLVSEVMGMQVSSQVASRCAFAVHTYLVSLSIAHLPDCDCGAIFGAGLTAADAGEVADEAVTFLLAGLDQTRARYGKRRTT